MGEKGEKGERGDGGGVMGGAGLITWNQCSWANLNAGQNYGELVVGLSQFRTR